MTEVISETEIQELESSRYYDCKTEVDIRGTLYLRPLYSGIYENGKHTNCFINTYHPWDVRCWWCLDGTLRDCICGIWCVSAHFESIGDGPEFNLRYEDIKFDCHNRCWHVRIPGRGIDPDHCADPYKVAVTVAYRTLCERPAPIVGHCELPLVTFYHSDKP